MYSTVSNIGQHSARKKKAVENVRDGHPLRVSIQT